MEACYKALGPSTLPGYAASVLYARELLVLSGFLLVLNWKTVFLQGILGTVSRVVDSRARTRQAIAQAQASRGMGSAVSLYGLYSTHGRHRAPNIIMNYR